MISFIVAVRNEEKALPLTLASLARYEGPHEIIVADDQSADGTIIAARQYADILVENTSPSRITIAANRNAAAARARGDYLVFADADSYVQDANEFFSKVARMFQENPRLVALTFFNRITPILETSMDRIFLAFFNWMTMLVNRIGTGSCIGKLQVVRATAFRRTGGYDPEIVAGEDVEFFRRLAKIGHTRCVRELVVYHSGRRQHVLGWLRLIWQWTTVGAMVFLFKRSHLKEWREIR